MSKIRFLYIFTVLFALVLFFPGCSNGSTPEKPPTTPTNNGALFSGKNPNANNYIFVSIYQTKPTGKLISPKKDESWFYAVAVVTFNQNGVPKPTTTSKGTITVENDNSLTFKADTGYGNPQSAKGTLNEDDDTLTMITVPGTVIIGTVKMELDMPITATPEKPFGIDDDDFSEPGSTSPTNPPPTGPTGPSLDYNAGKIATSIEIFRHPEWGKLPSGNFSIMNVVSGNNFDPNKRNMYFEGDPVNFYGTNIEVRVNFSDGTWTDPYIKADKINEWFVVEPPDFWLDKVYAQTWYNNGAGVGQTSDLGSAFKYGQISTDNSTPRTYTLYLKEGFGNSSILPASINSTLLPNTDWKLSATFKGPPNGNIFPIKEISYRNGNSSLREWLEDEVRVFPRDLTPPIRDVNNKDLILDVKWWGFNGKMTGTKWDVGDSSITNGSFSADFEGREINFHTRALGTYELNKRDSLLNVESIPNQVTVTDPVKFTVAIGTWSVPLSASEYHKVAQIVSSRTPDWDNHIIYDDPRLYSPVPNDPAINLHWLDKLRGGEITVSYVGTNTKRTRTIQQAFNNVGIGFIKYNAVPFKDAKGSVALNYFQTQILGYEVRVYNNLVEINIDPKGNDYKPYPVLNYTNGDNHEKYLEKMVWVRATYENGKDGLRVTRNDTYANTRPTVTAGENKTKPNENISSIGTFESNINDSLVKATKNYNKTPAESTKVRVYFNINGVKKYIDTQIGAVNYN